MKLKDIFQAAADVLMPRNCPVCGRPLDTDEKYICRECLLRLPRTHYEDISFNVMEQLFAGKVPIERAAAYFFYEKQNPYSEILQDIKYRDVPKMATWLTERAAREMASTGLWDGIDYLIPVPLHEDKFVKRGYNQSDFIAQGISNVMDIPIYEAIDAVKPHSTQTKKGAYERYVNSQGLYAPCPEASAELTGKHVMIIDDVVTTGATLLTCAESIQHIPGIKISLFTLAAAKLS